MAEEKQVDEMSPQKWTPPPRAEVARTSDAPSYPSFGAVSSGPGPRLEAIIRENPEAGAAAIADLLRNSGDEEKLSRLFAALRERLEGDVGSAVQEGPLLSRLQALEDTVHLLEEKLAKTGQGAVGSAPLAPHEVVLERVRQVVRERLENAAKQVRTVLVRAGEAAEEVGEEVGEDTLSIMEKVAVLFAALGEELTGQVMKYLSDAEIDQVSLSLANLEGASVEVQSGVLEEFESDLLSGNFYVLGGTGFVRGALLQAVGSDRAQEILDRALSTAGAGFYMLRNASPDQVAPFISHEHPQTIALILSQLDSAQAAGILAQLPERLQSNVAYRIATMENITPAILGEIEGSLESSLRDVLGGYQDVGGPKVVADMLNLTGSSVEKNVLDQMDGQDGEVAEAVRNLMFTFEDMTKLTDRELQTLMREVEQKDLVVALKAASEELKNKVLGNMSQRVKDFISEEMEFLGPMRLSEVEEVQWRIVQQVRQLEEQGKITIVRGDSDDTFV